MLQRCIVCGVGLILSQPAWADPLSADAQADLHKRNAYAAFECGRYTEAIAEFEAAHRLRRDPRLLYNVGLAYFKRHELQGARADLVQAKDVLQSFLQQVPEGGADLAERQKVYKARRFARHYLERVERLLNASPGGTALAPSTVPARPVPASRADGTSQGAGRGAASRPVQPLPSSIGPRRPHQGGRPWLHWLLYGAAAAALTTATATGVLALQADTSSDQLAARLDPAANREADRSRRFAATTDALLGTAIVLAVSGIWYHVHTSRSRRGAPPVAASAWPNTRLTF